MAQQDKIDITGNEDNFRTLKKIDTNFDRVFGSAIIQYADYTFTSTVAAQQMFNATTNGEVFIGVGTFQFETMFNMTGISATSGTFGYALGANNGLVIASQAWDAIAMKSTLATEAATVSTFNVAANTALTAAGTGTVGWAHNRRHHPRDDCGQSSAAGFVLDHHRNPDAKRQGQLVLPHQATQHWGDRRRIRTADAE